MLVHVRHVDERCGLTPVSEQSFRKQHGMSSAGMASSSKKVPNRQTPCSAARTIEPIMGNQQPPPSLEKGRSKPKIILQNKLVSTQQDLCNSPFATEFRVTSGCEAMVSAARGSGSI